MACYTPRRRNGSASARGTTDAPASRHNKRHPSRPARGLFSGFHDPVTAHGPCLTRLEVASAGREARLGLGQLRLESRLGRRAGIELRLLLCEAGSAASELRLLLREAGSAGMEVRGTGIQADLACWQAAWEGLCPSWPRPQQRSHYPPTTAIHQACLTGIFSSFSRSMVFLAHWRTRDTAPPRSWPPSDGVPRRGQEGLAPAHHPCRRWWRRGAPEP